MEEITRRSFEDYCDIITTFASTMHDYLYVHDFATGRFFINVQALDRFALPSQLFSISQLMPTLVHPDDLEALIQEEREFRAKNGKNFHSMHYRWMGRNGEPVWINCMGRILRNADGEAEFMIGCINEIGKKPMADNVTGLMQEVGLQKQLKEMAIADIDYSVLRIGIDDFRSIGERMGNEYGERILNNVARCIEEVLVDGQFVYHLQGDEFLVLDITDDGDKELTQCYERIRDRIDLLIKQIDYEVLITVSGGLVSVSRNDLDQYKKMMQATEYSISEAKRRGKNQLYIFDMSEYIDYMQKRELLLQMRRSVANNFNGFEVHFQPIIDVETGEPFGAESLLRFKTSEGELIPPLEFIPLLEESGLIVPVGRWVIQQALDMCAECRTRYPDFRISINLSYIQLLKSPLHYDAIDLIEAAGLNHRSVIMELTESGHLDNTPVVQKVWRKLKEQNVCLAIDDFGTGYSNLMNIGNLGPDYIKIDRDFSVRAVRNEYEKRLLKMVIEMVHSLNLKLIIEGVETETENEVMLGLGADYIQGFYYCKPIPMQQFRAKYM